MKNKEKMKRLSLAIVLVLVFASGYFLGTSKNVFDNVTDDNGNVEITKVMNLYQKTRSEKVDFDQFWDLWKLVKENYVDTDKVTDVDLFYGALEGLVAGLDDPHSLYLPPSDAEEFATSLSGKFEGIGAEIGVKEDRLLVVAPLKDSPAEKAGLKSGDFIVAIDDEETYGLAVDEAVTKIRGEKGTQVVLSILRDGSETIEDISITRDTINIPTIALEMKENNIAYVRLSYFNQDTASEFNKVVKEIISKNPSGIILDMRMNPGGYLDAAISVASEWVESGTIVKEVFSDDTAKEYPSEGNHRLASIKTIVLVDEGTASGSEIVAGALQDYGKATLVGVKTYGKGSVQSFEVFSDGSALKLTVAEWLTPKDRHINKIGIEPDVIVENMFEVKNEATGDVIDHGYDKAVELLNK
ncbi:MAG: S41 family peptidase [Candidatus Magasanikbacteria bacterium]